jgi:hypothetical protein
MIIHRPGREKAREEGQEKASEREREERAEEERRERGRAGQPWAISLPLMRFAL